MKSMYQSLVEYSHSSCYPFHMPGHKRQEAFGKNSILSKLYGIDITEVEGFDNLHHAEGIILEAQKRAARLYGSEETFFLVNGSTAGLLAGISTIAKEGKKLLVARNSHKSVSSALLLNRTEVNYIWPGIIREYGIQGEITSERVEKALIEDKDINGIVVTSPTYDGIVSDIRKICEIAHRRGIPVLVDSAHGAHFPFHKDFPEDAISQGADIVINSTHKTLPSMTQTALLHVQGDMVDRDRLKEYLRIYQTSSPSYILMASIDASMEWIEQHGEEGFQRLVELRDELDVSARNLEKVAIMPWERGKTDPGKFVISVKNLPYLGKQLYDKLLTEYHIQMEMATPNYVLGILTPFDTREGVKRLISALKEIESKEHYEENAGQKNLLYQESLRPVQVCSMWEAYQKRNKWLDLEHAANRICATTVVPYPPGIPILVPGEKIEEKHIEEITKALEMNLEVHGIETEVDKSKKISVICE